LDRPEQWAVLPGQRLGRLAW